MKDNPSFEEEIVLQPVWQFAVWLPGILVFHNCMIIKMYTATREIYFLPKDIIIT